MAQYDFTLRFDISRSPTSPDDAVELLAEHGCDDATVGIGIRGRIALAFTREAATAEDAIVSAVRDVAGALPQAVLVEAAPDYVGLSEIAALVGKTRQNLRKLLVDSPGAAPQPVHEGSSSIWHLAPVLEWLRDAKGYAIDQRALDVAIANRQVNAATTQVRISPVIAEGVQEYLAEA
jgi:predicted DNA-binding transcriptional regulator AlpA